MLASEQKINLNTQTVAPLFSTYFRAYTGPRRWGKPPDLWTLTRFTIETKPLSLQNSHEIQILLIPYPMCHTNSCFTVWNVLFLSQPYTFLLSSSGIWLGPSPIGPSARCPLLRWSHPPWSEPRSQCARFELYRHIVPHSYATDINRPFVRLLAVFHSILGWTRHCHMHGQRLATSFHCFV